MLQSMPLHKCTYCTGTNTVQLSLSYSIHVLYKQLDRSSGKSALGTAFGTFGT